MKSRLYVIVLLLFTAPLWAEEAPPSFLADVFGENSNGNIEYGFWYASWVPGLSATSQSAQGNIEVEPALLTSTSFRMQFAGTTNFFVNYVADEFFKEFEFETNKYLDDNEKEVSTRILAELKQRFGDYLLVYGSLTFGKFQAQAEGIPTDGNLMPDRFQGTYFEYTGTSAWVSSYKEYEAGLLLPTEAPLKGGSGVALRILNYRRPLHIRLNSGGGSGLDGQYLTVISDMDAFVPGLTSRVAFVEDDIFLDGKVFVGYGQAGYENDFFNNVDGHLIAADFAASIGFRFFNLDYVSGRVFLGYRGSFSYTTAGSFVDDDGSNPKLSVKSNVAGFNKGDRVPSYFDMWDIFHGPVFGAVIQF